MYDEWVRYQEQANHAGDKPTLAEFMLECSERIGE
jgi:hypothetical protein